MADEMVRRAQQFINATYSDGATLGISKLDENGQTGWTVMYALTRALQYEMGITTLSNNFGPTTLAAIGEKYGKLDDTTIPSANFCRIIQSALYCKGYDGGDIDGKYNDRVKAAVWKIKQDMGAHVPYPDDALWPKVVKGLFNMDAYVTVNNGSSTIRLIQQWLNGQYLLRKDFYIIPCDGHHSRDVAKSLILAVQYELGMADGVANGVFGPGTQSGLKNRTLSTGDSGVWVQLFSGAMTLNGRPETFTSSFQAVLANSVREFQAFLKLPVTGQGDFQTWSSLLVSYGDQSRKGEACDGVTKITPARAQALKDAGYKYIGRYLYNPSTTDLPEKEIQPGELATIKEYGLRCFPIYQTWARSVDYYSVSQGVTDCLNAAFKAEEHGFKPGSRIYFAVDYDAVNDEVTSHILPYFRSVRDEMDRLGSPYKIGVYGPRNACSRISEEGYASASFVSNMSSGFSGNLGYSMPENWAFDQIVTKVVGSGGGRIEIDNNIASGRDLGQGDFHPAPSQKLDIGFDMDHWDALLKEADDYMESIGKPGSTGYVYTRRQCLETIMSHDAAITSAARRYRMRKSLIQTSAFWEFCHYSYVDVAQDAGVVFYHTGIIPDWGKDLPGVSRTVDSSTGIAKISGRTCILSRNNSIRSGLLEGEILNSASDGDRWAMWQKANQDNAFNLSTVPHLHIWAADGKAGDHAETPIRRPALDYTDTETFEILRRYQGFGDLAESHAQLRMPLYAIFEKYNRIVRES
ncbi:glycoside hydrolase domain-containing protein [Streptomyces tailanensis]|uniref:glycoside hydrolase domain-containing protein n=1 Tax=Streptomyces tailanensis TaxID=2569858 RepID=UPI00122E197B|nr:glycoside hydrolase domain-containing protein [Streptomyces tailanensis]